MNTLIVYFSKFGHTQLVATDMARALESAGGLARVVSAEAQAAALIPRAVKALIHDGTFAHA